jgi:glycosyltransferase involved in cell wall biosynthesis
MATFNGERYLEEQLETIVHQRRLPDEVVVSDDGSRDRTLDIVRGFAADAPLPVRLLHTSARLGPAGNFEHAIRACTGDVVVLSDQDDRWRATRLERTHEYLIRNPATVGVFGNARVMDGEGGIASDLWTMVGFSNRDRRRWHHHAVDILVNRPIATGATMAFRTDASRLLPPPPGWLHDEWMALVLAARGELGFIDEPLIDYRLHGENTAGLPATRRLDRLLDGAGLQRETQSGIDRLGAAIEYLEAAEPDLAPGLRGRLEARAEHLRTRLEVQTGRFQPGRVGAELVRLRYHRYSRGLGSAVRDVMARTRRK